MNEGLTKRMNARIKPEDAVIHVGDFCNKGRNRGVEGMRERAQTYEDRLNGKWIHIKGNHDRNNGLKFAVDTMTMVMGNKQVLIRHKPVYDVREVPFDTDFVVCGHVHEKWQVKWIEDTDIPNINVGVDSNGLMPVRQDELIGIYHRALNARIKERDEAT